jgi:hypothetical protein
MLVLRRLFKSADVGNVPAVRACAAVQLITALRCSYGSILLKLAEALRHH